MLKPIHTHSIMHDVVRRHRPSNLRVNGPLGV